MTRPYNFSPGPAAVPEAVLQQAREELLDWHGCGVSVMEMSHRGKEFMSIAETAEANLRELLAIPDNYKVLFLQGGATGQFAAIPLNLLTDKGKADYLDTGIWSEKAIKEARRYGEVNIVASSQAQNYTTVPDRESWQCDAGAAYFHYTPNETIGGLEIHQPPDVGDVPLIADMSSTILSRPIDVSRFGMIYAGAQKNIGIAGLTVVIVRDDLLGKANPLTPTFLNYTVQAENDSMSNTPSAYAWYIAGLVFQWLKAKGGLQAIAEINRQKAELLYRTIDESNFFYNPIKPAYRSWMNVPFTLADAALDSMFLKESKDAGLLSLKGHRSVGGMRASIYNAMPLEGVSALVEFMQDFARRNG